MENQAEPFDFKKYSDYVEEEFCIKTAKHQIPERLDVYLAHSIRNCSRSKIHKAIEDGRVTVNGAIAKASKKVQPDDEIICKIIKLPPIQLIPENIPIEIVFEDDFLLVVNKTSGMVSHPAFGNRSGTLLNAILYHLGLREAIPVVIDDDDADDENSDEFENEADIYQSDAIRPGLVHRLDKDTSGLLVISKNPQIHAELSKQFADRTVEKIYSALVWGVMKDEHGTITGDIGWSPRDRKLFSVVKKGGKQALTEYTVSEKFEYLSLLDVKLHTGRTHQIRVHFSHNHHPVFGDVSYNGASVVFGGNNPNFRKIAEKCLKLSNHQLLHARQLTITHPITRERMTFNSELPEEFNMILKYFRG